MAARWVVQGNGLSDREQMEFQPQNKVIRLLAKLVSYAFHPLFIPLYLAGFLLTVHPYFFSVMTPAGKVLEMVRYLVIYAFFPLVTVLLAKGLGFLDSVFLKTQKERIIPYMACGIYYFWMCYVQRHQSNYAPVVIQLSMAIFIASSLGLIANIYMKISMHAMSMGILLAFIGMLAITQGTNYTLYFSVALLVAGLVCTARLIVSDHTQKEIYLGLLVGGLSQLLAFWADKILP